jgi:hypothetical protein
MMKYIVFERKMPFEEREEAFYLTLGEIGLRSTSFASFSNAFQESIFDCHSLDLVVIFLVFGVVFLLLLSLPLADFAGVGLVTVEIGENEVEDLRVPVDGVAFNTFLDGLWKSLLAYKSQPMYIDKGFKKKPKPKTKETYLWKFQPV